MDDNQVQIDILKTDLFGRVELHRMSDPASNGTTALVRRDTRKARRWTKPVARWLAAREARALARIALHMPSSPRTPSLLRWDGQVLERSWLPGKPMQLARPRNPDYYRQALRLLRQIHRAGVAHNDLAKEPNWLVLEDGSPAVLDFQLAWCPRRRGRLFRLLAREDLRHLLKHKRYYCPEHLSARQKSILDNPSWLTRAWMASGKKLYWLVTRKVLKWRDREGAGDRQL
jgi:RIO-like serine/threonine protein kinase